jgi:dnd system-associated protein 4
LNKSINQRELFDGDHTIYWPEKYEPVIEYLKNGTANKESASSLYKLNVHVIVLAACLGVVHNLKIPFNEKEKRKEVHLSAFNNNDLAIYIPLVALLDSKEPDVNFLRNVNGEASAVKIFEQYVSGGLEILYERYLQGFVDAPFFFISDLLMSSINFSERPTSSISPGGNGSSLPPEEELNLF